MEQNCEYAGCGFFCFLPWRRHMVTSWGSPADFLKQFLASAILFGVVVAGMRQVVRFNMLGLFLVIVCTTLLGAASELLTQPDQFYRVNGYGVLWPSWRYWRGRWPCGGCEARELR